MILLGLKGTNLEKEARLKMAAVMELIEQERVRLDVSSEKFANDIGLTASTYSRQNRGKQKLGLDALQAYARFARKVNNTALLQALGAYALELEPEEVNIKVKKHD
jgi:transcriptional regulator with XRE-family HTH domain